MHNNCQPSYARADIIRRDGPNEITISINDAKQVTALLDFFPNAGRRLESHEVGLWTTWLRIELYGVNNKTFVLRLDGDLKHWTEGKGDWVTKPGLREFLKKITGKDMAAPWA